MGKAKRRIRSPHPGVKLKKRERAGIDVWRAHYVDPDTGREAAVTLEPLVCGSAEARRRWAIAKAEDLARRRMDAAAGIRPADPEPGVPLREALELYRKGPAKLLKPKTIEGHELALAHFSRWAKRARITSTAGLTRAQLVSLREHLIDVRRSTAAPGGGRTRSDARRSPVTVNRELRSLKAVLNAWRTRELLPHLHRDAITDALRSLPVPREQPPYLAPEQLRGLIRAALRYDAETFAQTREEHDGLRRVGTTPRYDPIAPFLVTLLLTGMRRGEALGLEWSMVALDALDHEGRAVGEIRLPASATKTATGRTIGLEVSPGLRAILAALKLRGGGVGHVFGGLDPYSVDLVVKARRRLIQRFGAPPYTWQLLRASAATYLTCSAGIWGSATIFLSARQLGHSTKVAERHYLGAHRGIPREARTLEAAMQIEDELAQVLEAAGARSAAGGSAPATIGLGSAR